MNYIEVKLTPSPMSTDVCDVLAALLADLGYDSFETVDDGLKAYCPINLFSTDALNEVLQALPLPGVEVTWVAQEVQTQDWNAQWEEENALTPVAFGNETITIHPHMSFGSGHHETTSQLLERILQLDLQGREVLDMGTGTGVLGIACAMRGAKVRAIEIDDWVAANAVDNVLMNDQAGRVQVECGDASLLGNGQSYDVVLANINRNILVADMPAYVSDLKVGGQLLMSGFYEEDVPIISERAVSLGMKANYHVSRNNWVVLGFEKL